MSADFSKISGSLSSMFTNDNERPTSNNVLLITYKKSVGDVDSSPPQSPNSPFTRSYTPAANTTSTPIGTRLDNKEQDVVENCNGNNSEETTEVTSVTSVTSVVDSSAKSSPIINNNNIRGQRKNSKLEICKSLSSAESWESEDDCPPLASEDSDIGEQGEFESFSGTEDDEEEDDTCTLSVTQKSDESRLSFLNRRSLREKLRDTKSWSLRRSSEKELSPGPSQTDPAGFPESRLSRLFSLRRSLGGAGSSTERGQEAGMPRVAEEEESPGKREDTGQIPPSLPPTPLFLTAEQTKRRHIVSSLVHSENNYLASLHRLVGDYKLPLEQSSPPILSQAKVDILFHRVEQILAYHLQFRVALSEAVMSWDREEKIGDVFVSCFSKSKVLEIYSDFINNFNQAMELAKSESKRKSAFADFLKVKQITATDRLNFFGLMVKPIQRFPQFILLLQDLLKETPQGHRDRWDSEHQALFSHSQYFRMALQLALTTLESVAVLLNERKRDSEQAAAFHAKLRSGGSKLGKSESGRVLLREDDVQQLEFNSAGQVNRSKPRRLLLLNDQLVCAAVSGRASEAGEPSSLNLAGERLNVKWVAGLGEVDLVEGNVGTLARLTVAGSVSSKRSSLGRSLTPASLQQSQGGSESGQAENLAQDMADLMQDFDTVSRISSLIGTLKCPYPGMTTEITSDILTQIQTSIRQKDEEMSWLDKSCLHLAVRKKDKLETVTFQMRSPSVKDDWVVEHRLSRLARDPNNSPSWNILDQSTITRSRLPLFVKNVLTYQGPPDIQTEITCGTSYTLMVPTPTRSLRPVTYVWVNAAQGKSSHLRIYSAQSSQQISLKELGTITLSSCGVVAVVFVPGPEELVMVATDDRRILFYSASEPERGCEMGRLVVGGDIVSMLHHCGQVWVGLHTGSLAIIRPSHGSWTQSSSQALSTTLLGAEPVSVLVAGTNCVFTSSGRRVMMLDIAGNIVRSFTLSQDTSQDPGANIAHLAVAGVGLWVSVANTSIISLYHTESFIHMRDIDISSNVVRVLTARDNSRSVTVTALSAAKGLLWVGTNVGIALTIPLPRLEGVPIVSGKANISYHAHFGPVRMFLTLTTSVAEPVSSTRRAPDHRIIEEEPGQMVEVRQARRPPGSPVLGPRRGPGGPRKSSKTLPRGFSLSQYEAGGGDSVYGLYGDLLNVRDYECDSTDLARVCQENHKSDPELDTIQYRVSTLDRRVTMKSQRPRSLDLSSWSVSSHNTSSSDTCSDLTSPALSRNASFVSNTETSVRRRVSCKASASTKTETVQRTVTTLMGGRGYIQWRAAAMERHRTSHLAMMNNNDAFLVIWDHKL